MTKFFMSTLLVVMASVVLSACTPEPTVTDSAMEGVPSTEEVMENTEELGEEAMEELGMDETLEVTMDTGEFFFAPDTLEVKPGQTVELTLTNSEGEMPHDFVIDELDVQSDEIVQGEETVVTFTVPESAAGETYEFYCSVGQHRANGMVGTLVVSE